VDFPGAIARDLKDRAMIDRRRPVPAPLAAIAIGLVALAPAAGRAAPTAAPAAPALLDRVTWGPDPAGAAAIASLGPRRWLEGQLHPPADSPLPAPVEAELAAMPYLRIPMPQLVADARLLEMAANQITEPDLKTQARALYTKVLDDAAHQAAARSILRDLYSPDQLKEQMTWFWFNHFNVHLYKANIRLMIGDYEDVAIRPHALGRFRDLLEATLRHPAMLRYLDNADNAAGHINENYAREIMELHTMGVGAGYTQGDVQELARILTGVGIDANPKPPNLPPRLQGQLIREGLFEFNPARHDYGDKVFLGHRIEGRGFAEVEEALDILARHPATATHISRELAAFFVSDTPPEPLVKRMSATFRETDGDIARVLETMFASPEFKASLGSRFKDPAHYVLSAVRLAYPDRTVTDASPILAWLNRLGEGLYNHLTPDGYALGETAWNGPGQMETRFEVARQIGGGAPALFRVDPAPPGPPTPPPPLPPGYPDLRASVEALGLGAALAPETRAALAQAVSPRDWNALYLASPDFMRR
jgi:uncharacterized protein (DUF1800 family)